MHNGENEPNGKPQTFPENTEGEFETMKSIKLWILAGIFAFLGLIMVSLEFLFLLAPFMVIISGITTYYALKAEGREKRNGLSDKKNQGQVEA